MKARDHLPPIETAIVLCTDGTHLKIKEDGTGTTGNWKIDNKRKTDKVIIYIKSTPHIIFVAQSAGSVPSSEPGRFVINIRNIRNVGVTEENWIDFSESGRNPIRYLIR